MLYVIIIACGLFAELGVCSRLIEPGDPSATWPEHRRRTDAFRADRPPTS
ncbi:MAG: hypothetical protein R2705_24115 [Ilumatobacteraceae bacterium]